MRSRREKSLSTLSISLCLLTLKNTSRDERTTKVTLFLSLSLSLSLFFFFVFFFLSSSSKKDPSKEWRENKVRQSRVFSTLIRLKPYILIPSNNVRSRRDDRFSFCFFCVCFSQFQFWAVSSTGTLYTISMCLFVSLRLRVFRAFENGSCFSFLVFFFCWWMIPVILNRV